MADYQALMQSPAAQFLASIGKQGLQSGAISPDEASSHAMNLISSIGGAGGGGAPSMIPVQNPAGASNPPAASAIPMPAKLPGNAYARNTKTADKSTTTKNTTITRMSPDEMLDFSKSYNQLPEVQDQKQGQGDLENLFNMQKNYAQKAAGQLNLSPLMALADSQTGSDLQKGYTPPPTPGAAMGSLAGMAEKIQDKRQQNTKDLLSAFTAMKSGQQTQGMMDLQKQAIMSGFGNPNARPGQANADLFKWSGQYHTDPELNKASTALDSANQLQQLLTQNTSASAFMAKIQALRSSGLNRITNFEMGSFQGDSSAANRVNQAIQTLQTGNLDVKNIDNMKAAVQILADGAQKVKTNRMAYYKNLGTKAGLDVDNLLNPSGQTQAAPPTKVSVSNGKETRIIDAADLPHAVADGYKQVK